MDMGYRPAYTSLFNSGSGWDNVEYRSYNLKDNEPSQTSSPTHQDTVIFEETVESRHRRGKTGPYPTADEQGALFHTAMREWGNMGYKFKFPGGAPTNN